MAGLLPILFPTLLGAAVLVFLMDAVRGHFDRGLVWFLLLLGAASLVFVTALFLAPFT